MSKIYILVTFDSVDFSSIDVKIDQSKIGNNGMLPLYSNGILLFFTIYNDREEKYVQYDGEIK